MKNRLRLSSKHFWLMFLISDKLNIGILINFFSLFIRVLIKIPNLNNISWIKPQQIRCF